MVVGFFRNGGVGFCGVFPVMVVGFVRGFGFNLCFFFL